MLPIPARCKSFPAEGSPENHSGPIMGRGPRITCVERREPSAIPPPTTTNVMPKTRRGVPGYQETQHGLLNGQEGGRWVRRSVPGPCTWCSARSAPSYVRTAFHKVRHNAKDAVPLQFEIDRAREEIASLEPAIQRQHRERWPGPRSTSSTSTARSPRSGPTWTTEKKAMLTPAREPQDGRLPPGRPQPRRLHRGRGQGRPGPPARPLQATSSKILEEKEATLKAKQKASRRRPQAARDR